MKKNWLIVLITLIIVSSCEMVIEVNVPREKPKLVVNCIFNSESTWRVSVFKNRYILDEDPFQSIENAQVKIVTETNEEITLTHKQNGQYTSTRKPEHNNQFKIVVSAEGFESVSAIAALPEVIPIISVVIDSNTVIHGNGGGSRMPIEVTFNDPGNSVNTYEVKLFEKVETTYLRWDTQEYVTDTISVVIPLVIDDPSDQERTSVFNDLLLNGKQHTLKSTIGFSAPYGGDSRLLKATVILINISEEYFNYLNSSNLQRNTDGDPFAQPVQVYNNIENGLGIFGGYTASEFVLKE